MKKQILEVLEKNSKYTAEEIAVMLGLETEDVRAPLGS